MKPIDIYEKKQEMIYNLGLSLLKYKNDKTKIADAMKIFKLISNYKDADKKIEYCSKILSNNKGFIIDKIVILLILVLSLLFFIYYSINNGIKKIKASEIYDKENQYYYSEVSPSGFVYIYLQNGKINSHLSSCIEGGNRIEIDSNGVLKKDIFVRTISIFGEKKYYYYKSNGEKASYTDIEMYDVRYKKIKHYYFGSDGYLILGGFNYEGTYFDEFGDTVKNKVISKVYNDSIYDFKTGKYILDYDAKTGKSILCDKPNNVTKYYYIDANGKAIFNSGWINVDIDKYYNKNGSLVHDETIEIDGKIYTFDKNCKLVN